jgi:hypothetical protein
MAAPASEASATLPKVSAVPEDSRREDSHREDLRRENLRRVDLRPELDDLTRRVLEFERARSRGRRSKERAIREGLGITPTRYHQVLAGALDRPEALAFDAMLVRRLRRLRDARRRVRFAHRLGHPDAHG